MPSVRLLACSLSLLIAGHLLASGETAAANAGGTTAPVAPDGPRLSAARNGAEVLLTWEIPTAFDVRLVELLRHTQREQKGRSRVASVHARPGLYTDKVPVPAADYWYWLKITLQSGQIVGVGPVQTPSAEVWTPGS